MQREGHITENVLLKEIADGDWQAYNHLVREYFPRLYTFLMRLTGNNKQNTEDILQDIFLAVWEKRGQLPLIRSVEQYLFRMVRNRFLDQIRKEDSRQKVLSHFRQITPDGPLTPFESALEKEYQAQVVTAINQLSPKLKNAFLLSSQQELSIDEISGILRIPRETVKKRLYLAGRSIREYLRKHGSMMVMLLEAFALYRIF
ncbi:MAG TPA: sigma-70 family RNA polymerase sigma factor [Parasegetibacter sp.]